jgi:hypothetical protein
MPWRDCGCRCPVHPQRDALYTIGGIFSRTLVPPVLDLPKRLMVGWPDSDHHRRRNTVSPKQFNRTRRIIQHASISHLLQRSQTQRRFARLRARRGDILYSGRPPTWQKRNQSRPSTLQPLNSLALPAAGCYNRYRIMDGAAAFNSPPGEE